eukprot:14579104-Ditylum_brightwellii.AAC.1
MTLKDKKSVSAHSKDITLAMHTLKEISKNMEAAAVSHLSSYDQAVCKRKHVQKEDEFFKRN